MNKPSAPDTVLFSVQPDGIPQELRNRRQWVVWKLVHRAGESKPTKIPVNPNDGSAASSTAPDTWGTFNESMAYRLSNSADGVGFVFSAQDPYTGIDLDNCRDVKSGTIEPWARDIVEALHSYTELSPSGRGLHVIVRGKIVGEGRKRGKIEMYSSGRFFAFTGRCLPGAPRVIEERQETLSQLHSKVFSTEDSKRGKEAIRPPGPPIQDDELLRRAASARDGQTFNLLWQGQWEGLYPSQSEADLALCGKLAFWSGGDSIRMDRLFRQSGLFRPKWDEPHFSDGRTYGESTLDKALTGRNHDVTSVSPARDAHEPDPQERLHLTDTWNAHRLVSEHGDDILWCEVFKQWYVYDGTRYALDVTREIERRAERTVKGLYEFAGTLASEDRRRVAEWAIGSEGRHRMTNMVESAKRLVPVDPSEFDKNPWLFNVLNGTIDLRTQKLLPHKRGDRISKRSPVWFDSSAGCPLWIAFLNRIFDGNKTIIAFVQRIFGYCLTGLITEQIIIILYGVGANGKSTLLRILRSLGGDYAYHCRPEVFTAKRNDSQGFELVPLAGTRIVTSTETSAGRRLDESLVKEMTGGEPVNCAPKYGAFFTFQPAFKPLLATNHKPEIRGADEGIWRRVRLLPFNVTIPEEERDPDLSAKLDGELSGILNWGLEGLREFLKGGLQTPDEVRSATAVYRAEQDVLGNWIEENCVLDGKASDEYAALYQDYVKWCESNHEEPVNKTRFSSSLDERGLSAHRGAKGKRMRLGISRRVTGDVR